MIEAYFIIGIFSSSLKFGRFSSCAGAYPRKPGEFLRGSWPLEDLSVSITHGSVFFGMIHGWDVTRALVDII